MGRKDGREGERDGTSVGIFVDGTKVLLKGNALK